MYIQCPPRVSHLSGIVPGALLCLFFFFLMIRPPPSSTLFPSPPLFRSDEGSFPIIRRAFDPARRIGSYAMVQVIGQIIAFSSGILLVRWLPQREYAFFTIANEIGRAHV